MSRTTLRRVDIRDKSAMVADWWYSQHASECYTRITYPDAQAFIEHCDSSISDGECVDMLVELYDKGILYI